jgi:23S rRNA (pseudouridine1915-N3)-methyltransferase
MQIILLAVGKTNEKWLKAGIDDYTARLKHYASFKIETIPEGKYSNKSPEEIKRNEAEQISKFLLTSDKVVLLDEHGLHFSSRDFADKLQKWMNSAPKRIVFVSGGAFGLDKSLQDRCEAVLSLSKMTFTHQMIRLIFTEQLYRAFTILKGENYHND